MRCPQWLSATVCASAATARTCAVHGVDAKMGIRGIEVKMAGASPRRAGADNGSTREALYDAIERVMADAGYAGVSYRSIAAQVGVVPSLVQYYFPTVDDIFISAIRRRTDSNRARLTESMHTRPHEQLRVLWEFSWEEGTGALMSEFMAAGNHRPRVGTAIAEEVEKVRAVELRLLTEAFGPDAHPDGPFSMTGLLMLITGMPKYLNIEAGVGIETGHRDVIRQFERYLDEAEAQLHQARHIN
jgi:TetR/AcrR family transcriptional regulator, transcriptional repressor for nem operon